jgi:hypothetical protein
LKRAKNASSHGNLARFSAPKSPYAKSIKVLQFSTIGCGHYFPDGNGNYTAVRLPKNRRVIKDETFAQTHWTGPMAVLVWYAQESSQFTVGVKNLTYL